MATEERPLRSFVASLEARGRGAEPRNVGSLLELGRAQKQILP